MTTIAPSTEHRPARTLCARLQFCAGTNAALVTRPTDGSLSHAARAGSGLAAALQMAQPGRSRRSAHVVFCVMALLALARPAPAATYAVGPGQAYATPSNVPWETLQPGDQVLIYWRSTPYKDKWVICRQGTELAPIVVRGVAGPGGELPIIEGGGATTRLQLDYWGESRAVIKIGGASIPADTMPRYITIENLDVRSARPPYTFTDD